MTQRPRRGRGVCMHVFCIPPSGLRAAREDISVKWLQPTDGAQSQGLQEARCWLVTARPVFRGGCSSVPVPARPRRRSQVRFHTLRSKGAGDTLYTLVFFPSGRHVETLTTCWCLFGWKLTVHPPPPPPPSTPSPPPFFFSILSSPTRAISLKCLLLSDSHM